MTVYHLLLPAPADEMPVHPPRLSFGAKGRLRFPSPGAGAASAVAAAVSTAAAAVAAVASGAPAFAPFTAPGVVIVLPAAEPAGAAEPREHRAPGEESAAGACRRAGPGVGQAEPTGPPGPARPGVVGARGAEHLVHGPPQLVGEQEVARAPSVNSTSRSASRMPCTASSRSRRASSRLVPMAASKFHAPAAASASGSSTASSRCARRPKSRPAVRHSQQRSMSSAGRPVHPPIRLSGGAPSLYRARPFPMIRQKTYDMG